MVLAPPRAILDDRAHVSEISPWPAEMWILTFAGTGTVVSLWGFNKHLGCYAESVLVSAANSYLRSKRISGFVAR